MKVLNILKVLPLVLCVAFLAGCSKGSDESNQEQNKATVSIGGGDLSKMTQPCTIDGAKVAGLNAGQGKSKPSNDYAKDNNCTSDQTTLNTTYQKYVENGQQIKGLGIKVGS